jgi:2',3'-cyclic-nucleotide 2'-phosphodiesterase (5'-nucleotidase family)
MTSKYICANFCTRKDNKPVFDPYKIIEATLSDDTTKKIAFIGIVTPKTFSNTYLSSIKDSDGNAVYNFLSEGDLLAEAVQKYID